MPMYQVELKISMVVVAEDETEAYRQALRSRIEAISDDLSPDIEVIAQITGASDLEDGWTEDALPYGGPEGRTIGELLAESADVPT